MPDSYASWADYYQPQQSQYQQSPAPYSGMFPGILSWMAQPWPLQPQQQQPDQRQRNSADESFQSQNFNRSLQQMGITPPVLGDNTLQFNEDYARALGMSETEIKRRKSNSQQQMMRSGMQLLSPQMPGTKPAMPYGLAPTFWANPNQGY